MIGKLGKLIKQLEGAEAFHDIILRTLDGSTQIDHLLISTNGIFVIETKNMSGWILGGEKQKYWTQTLFKVKTKFQNPIHQNYKHVKAVQDTLGIDSRVIFNVVVFVGGAEFKTDMPSNVVYLKDLLPYIRSNQQSVLSISHVNKYASKILSASSENPISEKGTH